MQKGKADMQFFFIHYGDYMNNKCLYDIYSSRHKKIKHFISRLTDCDLQ